MNTDDLINGAKEYLTSKKLDGFEIFYLEDRQFMADAKGGVTESLQEATEVGLSVRVVNGHRLGFSYTTSLKANKINDCIDMAVAGSREVDADDSWAFAASEPYAEFGWKYYDEKMGTVPVSEKVKKAALLEAASLGTDPRMKNVRRAAYEESDLKIRLVNSHGVDLAFQRTMAGCRIVAIAEENGDSQWASDIGFSHTVEGLDIEDVGRRAALDALSLLGAKSIPTMKTPACIHPYVAAEFLKYLSRGFFGDNIFKKKSTLVGKLGEGLYSKVLNIVNDGLMKGGYASSPFDGEGEPCKKIYLVKGGVVENWLTNIYWGKKLGRPSTGSSSRSSVKELPEIGSANLYIEPGQGDSDALLAKMDKGFFITDVSGSHTINSVTGDFSVGAGGQWVEGGKIVHPVKGVIVAGNLHELFKNVTAAGADLRFMGKTGSPTLLVSEIQVSG